MKIKLYITTVLTILLSTSTIKAQNWQNPIIKEYGQVTEYPEASHIPNPDSEYNVLFHIKSDKERGGVNASLWKIARLINLMGISNVPKEHVDIVAVISGPATPISLSNIAYKREFQKDNPNIPLLKQLHEYGVQIEVCGQALAQRNIDAKTDLNEFTGLTLSALTAILTYQAAGYVPML